jgi:hypothetical protein
MNALRGHAKFTLSSSPPDANGTFSDQRDIIYQGDYNKESGYYFFETSNPKFNSEMKYITVYSNLSTVIVLSISREGDYHQ